MDPDPKPVSASSAGQALHERALHLDCPGDRVARAPEREEGPVTGPVDLGSVV